MTLQCALASTSRLWSIQSVLCRNTDHLRKTLTSNEQPWQDDIRPAWSANKILVLDMPLLFLFLFYSLHFCCLTLFNFDLNSLKTFEEQNNIPGTAPLSQRHADLWTARGTSRHTNRSGKGHGVKTDANAVLHNCAL